MKVTKTQTDAVAETVRLLHALGHGDLADDVETAVAIAAIPDVQAPQHEPEW